MLIRNTKALRVNRAVHDQRLALNVEYMYVLIAV